MTLPHETYSLMNMLTRRRALAKVARLDEPNYERMMLEAYRHLDEHSDEDDPENIDAIARVVGAESPFVDAALSETLAQFERRRLLYCAACFVGGAVVGAAVTLACSITM